MSDQVGVISLINTLPQSTMKILLVRLFIILILIQFLSCSPVLYSNNGANVPLFQNKSEVVVSAGVASTDHASGLGLQAGVAFDSAWSVIASFYSLKEKGADEDWSGNGRYVEFGVGRFGKVFKKGSFFTKRISVSGLHR